MKKIFTLLFAAVASIGIASAQSGNHNYHERTAQHRPVQQEKFVSYHSERNIPVYEHSRQVRVKENNCYKPVDRFHARFEIKHHGFEEKRIVKNEAHRW